MKVSFETMGDIYSRIKMRGARGILAAEDSGICSVYCTGRYGCEHSGDKTNKPRKKSLVLSNILVVS